MNRKIKENIFLWKKGNFFYNKKKHKQTNVLFFILRRTNVYYI